MPSGKSEWQVSDVFTESFVLHDIRAYDPSDYSRIRNKLTTEGFIGGSMAGAVLGVNPFMSKMQAWLMLSGMYDMQEENERMWAGRHLEPVVKAMFTEKTGIGLTEAPWILQSKEYPWMIATLDAMILDDITDRGVFEAKTTSLFQTKTWDNGAISDPAHAQALHNMAVTGFEHAHVACLIGGQRFVHACVERDQVLIDHIIEIERGFYQSVLEKNPPAWEGDDLDLLAGIYPGKQIEVIELPAEAPNLASHYLEAKSEMTRWRDVVKDCEAKLKGMMADNEVALCDGYRVQWKTINRGGYEVKPTSYRKFSVKES